MTVSIERFAAEQAVVLGDNTDDLALDCTRHELANGLVVIVHPAPEAAQVSLTVCYRVGSKDEGPGQTGSAHLFEHLMFTGSANLPGGWAESMKAVGGTNVNAYTSHDRTCFYQTIPLGSLAFALWAEADRMGHFREHLSDAALAREKAIVLEEKSQREGVPLGEVSELVLQSLFPPGHPYHHTVIGSVEDIAGVSLISARDWHHRYYGPDNAVVVIAGPIDPQQTLALVKEHFDHLPPSGREWTCTQAWVPALAQRRRARVASHAIDYDEVQLIWPVAEFADKGSAHLAVLADLLGGSELSPLYLELVKPGHALNASAIFTPGEVCGQFLISLSLEQGRRHTDVAERVRGVIAKVLDGPADSASFERLCRQKRIMTVMRLGSVSARVAMMIDGEMSVRDPWHFQHELADLQTTDAERVIAQGRRWLSAEPFVLEVHSQKKVAITVTDSLRSPRPSVIPQVEATNDIEWDEVALFNGTRLVTSQRPGARDFVLRLELARGNGVESEAERGFCALLSTLPYHGIGERSPEETRIQTQEGGIGIVCGATVSYFSIELNGPATSAAQAVELLADLVLRPRLDTFVFDEVRRDQRNGLIEAKVDRLDWAMQLPRARLYGAQSIEIRDAEGSAMAIEQATRATVLAFHERLFDPQGARLFATGSEQVLATVRPRLSAFTSRWRQSVAPFPEPVVPALPDRADERIQFVAAGPSDQAVIQLALLLPHPLNLLARETARTLVAILQERINHRLREELGWTYGVSAGIAEAEMTALPPCLMLTTSVNAQHAGEAVLEIRTFIQAFVTDAPPTAVEMQEQQRQAGINLSYASASTSGLAMSVLDAFRLGLKAPLGARRAALANVSAAAVVQVLQDALANGPVEWVVASTATGVADGLSVAGLPIDGEGGQA
ncbi:insulinase family protein [Pseudomonas sp. 13B_2.1_Bac1]|uniref:M16 family metallopeptidase n=1 Tax=Pseudomonas sp. 13B_2.1_Bac1 TaxID=2971624 RepID=UPI0021C9B859|nr:M16 family metallopeptidase [Pseudomonas sp. 13B_2.1_Bac1]MCU1785289.1 insulinase family protein [Pseudomonas sp. 13B_2.1_Bac1]